MPIDIERDPDPAEAAQLSEYEIEFSVHDAASFRELVRKLIVGAHEQSPERWPTLKSTSGAVCAKICEGTQSARTKNTAVANLLGRESPSTSLNDAASK